MNGPNERLNEQLTESPFSQSEHEAEPRSNGEFGPHDESITGGKGPGLSEEQSE